MSQYKKQLRLHSLLCQMLTTLMKMQDGMITTEPSRGVQAQSSLGAREDPPDALDAFADGDSLLSPEAADSAATAQLQASQSARSKLKPTRSQQIGRCVRVMCVCCCWSRGLADC